jgi:ubiquinol-cytochrome c reductase cytochrome c subunit
MMVAIVFFLAAIGGSNAGGAELYALHCASCHGAAAQGTPVAPPLVGKNAADIHLMLDTGRMPAADPNAPEVHTSPAFTQPQMAALVKYVQRFSEHADTSLPLMGGGDPVRGRALFAENCAMCHGAGANGSSIGFANVAPSLMHATAFQIGEAIRAGPEIMPRFGPDVLSDRDVRDIARYVNVLQTQSQNRDGEDAGGLALGHIGPVAEGIIAWLFGAGILILFIRLIGTTD